MSRPAPASCGTSQFHSAYPAPDSCCCACSAPKAGRVLLSNSVAASVLRRTACFKSLCPPGSTSRLLLLLALCSCPKADSRQQSCENMSLADWKDAKQRLEGLYPDSAQRGLVTSSLRDLSLDERLEYFEGDDDYVRAGLSKFTRTIQDARAPGGANAAGMVTLAVMATLTLPQLEYRHRLSATSTSSVYEVTPDDVTSWETFDEEVAGSSATLDDTIACHERQPFPTGGGQYKIESEADVNAYLQQYLYNPLEDAFPLSGFSSQRIKQKTAVFDMKGELDFAATAIDLAGQERLLFAAKTKTVMSFPVPYGTTTAEAWQDPERRSSITKAVGQAFGYLLSNDLIYGLLTSGERFVFIQRKGRSIEVADVYRTSREPTPMASIIYLMQRGAEHPGKQVGSRKADLELPAGAPPPTLLQFAFSAASWAWQQLGQVGLHIAGWWAVKQLLQALHGLRPVARSKELWSLEELSLTAEIGRGRTGRVYVGCINRQSVAVKLGDYAASKRSLKELQHEVAVYEHLRGEQGVSVPRFVACGYIVDSTLYFLATELLGPSLESAGDDLEPAALHALQRVHACGVLHRDVRSANFLRCGRNGVVLADLACAQLAADPQLLQQESSNAAANSKLGYKRKEVHRQRPVLPIARILPNTQLRPLL